MYAVLSLLLLTTKKHHYRFLGYESQLFLYVKIVSEILPKSGIDTELESKCLGTNYLNQSRKCSFNVILVIAPVVSLQPK